MHMLSRAACLSLRCNRCRMGDPGAVDPRSQERRDDPRKLSGERSSMAFCMCCAVAVPGGCCPMICLTGVPSTCIFASGNGLGSGSRSTPPCDGTFVSAWDAIPNQARPFWIVNRSKPVRCVAMSEATTGGNKIQGRKRHLLVDTHGLLLAVKVLAADIRDRAGGQVLLTALRGKLPRLQVIWGDSGYAGEPFEGWVKDHLGVRFEIVKHPWTGLRGVWAPEGATIDWDKIMPRGFHVRKLEMGGGTDQCLDHASPSPLARF